MKLTSNRSCNFAKSHSPLTASINWLTTRGCWTTKLSLAMGLKLSNHGTQESSHILTSCHIYIYILRRKFYLWSQLSSLRYMMHKLFWIESYFVQIAVLCKPRLIVKPILCSSCCHFCCLDYIFSVWTE